MDLNTRCRCAHKLRDHIIGLFTIDDDECARCGCREFEPCDHDHPQTVVSGGGYGRGGNCGEEFREPSDAEKYGVRNGEHHVVVPCP